MDEAIFKEGIPLLDGELLLKVSQDGLEAAIYGQDLIVNFSKLTELPQILQEQGIVHGILSSPEMLEDRVVVARGTPPIHGEDGSIELVYSREAKELLDQRGISDPRETNSIINVRKGEVVARRLPPTKGTDGTDVFGRPVPAEPGQWVPFKLGQGVEIDEDGDELLATVSGKLSVDPDGTISVLEEYTVDGDVDWSTGNISFVGRLLRITGDVKPGFSVAVEHDLIIEGSVEDEAKIKVDGSLNVKGIIRAAATRVEVGGDLECGAIEYALVAVRGDLEVHDYLLDAKCLVGGHVAVMDGKGTVAGGRLILGRSVVARVLGSTAYVQTEISAGYDPEIMKIHGSVSKDIEELAAKQKQIGDLMLKMAMMAKKKGLDPGLKAKRDKLKLAWQGLEGMLAQKKKLLAAMEEKLGQLELSTVTVLETVYPNCNISIAGVSYVVKEELHRVRFHFKSGAIAVSSLPEDKG